MNPRDGDDVSACLDDDEVSRLLDGSVSAEERARMEDHIDACATCRRHLSALVELDRTRPLPGTADARSLAPSRRPYPGRVLGRYTLLRPVGLGATGTVWAATDPELERTVALKIFRVLGEQREVARRLREARVMAKTRHPNVLDVYDVGQDGPLAFIVTALVEAGTLADAIAEGPLPWRDVLRIGREVAAGADALHRAGLLHRDIKPGNILLAPDRALLADLGLARQHSEETPATGEVTMDPDASSRGGGTLGYAAPEQLTGRGSDVRSDVFGLAAALWAALAGTRPFAGVDADSTLAAIAAGPSPLRRVPRSVVACIRAGLASDPSARPDSMAAFAASLERAGAPGRLGKAAAVAAAATVLVVGGILRSAPNDDATPALPTVGFASMALRAELRQASDEGRRGNLPEARALLVTTTAEAEALGLDALAAEGWVEQVWLAADGFEDLPRALQLASFAQARLDRLDDGDALRVRLHQSLGAGYLGDGDFAAAAAQYEAALALVGDDALQRARVLGGLANAATAMHDFDRAIALLERSLELRLAAGAPAYPDLLHARFSLAGVRGLSGHVADALVDYEHCLEIARAHDAVDEEALVLMNYGSFLRHAGRFDEAIAAHERAVALRTESFGSDSVKTAKALDALGNDLGDAGRYEEALQRHHQALVILEAAEPRSAPVLESLESIANMKLMLGRYEEAETDLRTLLRDKAALYGPEAHETLETRANLALALTGRGRLEQAERELQALIAVTMRLDGPDAPRLGFPLAALAELELRRGREAVARRHLARARAVLGTEGSATERDLRYLERVHARLDGDP